ncbi:cytosine permease [Miltoncostaea oceani]|jgi:cytosine permease|uniref:cytosine permease n=1 Tax=Miltoncostaea oceani TaxID=2843216 RepID=UPI001C3C5E80|nr:cytosine permease [Miltoncostaea oceani]
MGGDGWIRRLGPWVGIGTSPAALMTGGGVGRGLRGGELVAALVTGVALLAGIALLQGLIGQRTGRTLGALTAGPLGVVGSRRSASVVMLAMMIGWFGVNVGVAGVAVARLTGMPDLAGIAVFAVLMLGVVTFGLGALSWSALVAGLATTGLAAYGLHLAFADREVTLSGGEAGSHPISFTAAVALMVGYGAAFSLRTPDFTHDLARPRQVVWCALAGLVVPVLVFTLAGAALQAATGSFDLADVLRDLGSPGIAYLFVAVGFTGSVLTNIWSGGLSLTDVAPGIPHAAALVGVTVVGGIVAAGGLADHMLPWLTVMALAAPGLVAVCAIHALRGGPAIAGWGTTGLCCWGAGFGCGIALHLAGSGLALPAAAAVPAIGYWWFGPTEERNLADANAGG